MEFVAVNNTVLISISILELLLYIWDCILIQADGHVHQCDLLQDWCFAVDRHRLEIIELYKHSICFQVLLAPINEPWMLQALRACEAIIRVNPQHQQNEFLEQLMQRVPLWEGLKHGLDLLLRSRHLLNDLLLGRAIEG